METLDQIIATESALRETLLSTPHIQVQGRLQILREITTRLLDTQKQLVEIENDPTAKERQEKKYADFWRTFHNETFKELKGHMNVLEVSQNAINSFTN